MIGSLPSACPYNCGYKTTRSEMKTHLRGCPMIIYECALNSCKYNSSFEYSTYRTNDS